MECSFPRALSFFLTFGEQDLDLIHSSQHRASRLIDRSMTHDPKVYKKPMEFNPGRFLGDAPEQDPKEIVFGFGRRFVQILLVRPPPQKHLFSLAFLESVLVRNNLCWLNIG